MIIRVVNPDDYASIGEIHRLAFSTSDLGYNGEAELVSALHDDGDAVCSLVAEADGRLKGHVLFSRMTVQADSRALRAAALGPISILPDAQRSGIGASLIEEGLMRLKADGFQISFVLGHPAYYPRFGYLAELAFPYQSSFAGPHFMAVQLDSSLAVPQSGKAEYAPAFMRMG
jgi:putative acetyltransferase